MTDEEWLEQQRMYDTYEKGQNDATSNYNEGYIELDDPNWLLVNMLNEYAESPKYKEGYMDKVVEMRKKEGIVIEEKFIWLGDNDSFAEFADSLPEVASLMLNGSDN